LFGLAIFMAERRNKGIGVRKVLKFFLTMKNWLQQYDYRIHFSWWVFALAGLGAILIALITVSFQAVKAAIANPVKSLRTE